MIDAAVLRYLLFGYDSKPTGKGKKSKTKCQRVKKPSLSTMYRDQIGHPPSPHTVRQVSKHVFLLDGVTRVDFKESR